MAGARTSLEHNRVAIAEDHDSAPGSSLNRRRIACGMTTWPFEDSLVVVTSFLAHPPASGRGTIGSAGWAAGAARRVRGPFITVPIAV